MLKALDRRLQISFRLSLFSLIKKSLSHPQIQKSFSTDIMDSGMNIQGFPEIFHFCNRRRNSSGCDPGKGGAYRY